METTINSPAVSKINYTALMIQIIGIAAILNWIPADLEQPVVEITMIVLPGMIQVFRTWFTKKKAAT